MIHDWTDPIVNDLAWAIEETVTPPWTHERGVRIQLARTYARLHRLLKDIDAVRRASSPLPPT